MYNVFISHAWKYSDDYKQIEAWLKQAREEGKLEWRNFSVPEHNPILDPEDPFDKEELKKELKKQIELASVVIIISGMYVAYSDWIDYELDTAVSLGKKIIGVEPWGQKRIPAKVSCFADKMVGWNKQSVINALTTP